MKFTKIFTSCLLYCTTILAQANSPTHVDAILERLNHANAHRDHIMVVAHRGLWNKEGQAIYAENSVASIRKAIELGVEVVEQDIRQSKDGVFVVLHDKTLDRTTTCQGLVEDKTWQELQSCKLTIHHNGETTITDEHVMSLSTLYDEIKGKILLNLDNKIGYQHFPAMFELAKKHGVAHQVLATVAQNTPEQIKSANAIRQEAKDYQVHLMPFFDDANVALPAFLQTVKDYQPHLVQVVHTHGYDQILTQDGGAFFGKEAQQMMKENNAHYWLNTLYVPKTPGRRSGGRGDEMAYYAGLPNEVYGFWIKKGVTMFQTDEPEFLLNWLNKNGYRKAYSK